MSLHLIEVGSTSCGVCKMMKPMVERAVSKFTPDKLTFVYINGDTEEGKEMMEKYSIESVGKVPSFFFKIQNEDGTWHLLDKFDGGVSLFTLMSKINNCLV